MRDLLSLLVCALLLEPAFVGIRTCTLIGQSRTLAAARRVEIDWRIGFILYRLQGWPGLRFPRPGRRRCLGRLTLHTLQTLRVRGRRRCGSRTLANRRALFRRLFLGRLNLERVALLRQAACPKS